jgi:hypothetical protein
LSVPSTTPALTQAATARSASRPGFRFQLSTVDMLDVAGAFEAIVRSMVEGGSVSLRRT